jgi:hypothetical protein
MVDLKFEYLDPLAAQRDQLRARLSEEVVQEGDSVMAHRCRAGRAN